MPHPSGRPWVIAHRGASAARPENTIDAFVHAARLGADAVELDVRLTRDHQPVVIHDAALAGTPVIEMTRSELSSLRPEVPDFADAVAACEPIWMDVEIKNAPFEPDWDPDDAALDAVAQLLPDDAVVTSFNLATVERAAALGIDAGWLLPRAVDPAAALADWPGFRFVLPGSDAMAQGRAGQVVAVAQVAGAEVAVWTIDDPDEIRRLADAGVGAICTNVPDIALSALSGG